MTQDSARHDADSSLPRMLHTGLRTGQAVRLRVASNSMWPLLQRGDEIEVVRVPPADLTCGEVVTFIRGPSLYTHRLVARGQGWYTTRGDNSLWPDPALPPTAVLGRVVAIERGSTRLCLGHPVWWAINRLLGWLRQPLPATHGRKLPVRVQHAADLLLVQALVRPGRWLTHERLCNQH